jgi:peptidyl-tRNA hydrolase, PTH1 family
MAVKAIVGLGNPGTQYAGTRHNAGFIAVEALARNASTGFWKAGQGAWICEAEIEGQHILLAKPMTFMNASGEAVMHLMEENRMTPGDFMLMVDDFSLPLGRIRIRESGSAGGHHGLESIFRMIGSEAILRIRLGIGEETMPADKAKFVLSEFPRDRRGELDEMITKACAAVRMILVDGVSKAMAVYNA